MRWLPLLLLAGCIHEQQVVRLREDAIPWKLGQPYEDRVDPARNDARVLRFEELTAETVFTCKAQGGAVLLTVFANDRRELASAPCNGAAARIPGQQGPIFVLARVSGGPADLSVTAEAH